LAQARDDEKEPYHGSRLSNATFKSYDVDAGNGPNYENHFHNLREELKAQQAILKPFNNLHQGHSLVQARENPDGYTFNYDNLENSLRDTAIAAENAREAIVNKEEAANAWRDGWTGNTGEVFPYGLVQRRAIPDGYHFNYDNLETSI